MRAAQDAQGKTLKSDRRAATVTEQHLYDAAHEIIDLAIAHGAEIVFLEDPTAHRPKRWLKYSHFAELARITGYLAPLAGLVAGRGGAVSIRPIYGSGFTCLACGWAPQAPGEVTGTAPCPRCGAERDETCHQAMLLAWDVLRFREHPRKESRPFLGEYIARHSLKS